MLTFGQELHLLDKSKKNKACMVNAHSYLGSATLFA